jgi:hypothetical protein
LLDVQLPASTFMRYASIFYVNTICRFVSFLVTGNTVGAKALLPNIDASIDLEKLHSLLIKTGFEVTINKSYNDSILTIKGRRYSPAANIVLENNPVF